MKNNERVITGNVAIEAKRMDPSIQLNKDEDPIEGAAENITIDAAQQVAKEDPGLIWAEVDVVCEINGVRTDIPEGYNIADYYDSQSSHKGADEDGVNMFYVAA